MNQPSWLPEYDWPDLEQAARAEVQDCQRRMPANLRALAESVPCLLRRWHPDLDAANEEYADFLGEYLSYEENGDGAIALYLGGIALYCQEEDLVFEDEVRTTYLHELGHHFGWDEDQVEQRGL